MMDIESDRALLQRAIDSDDINEDARARFEDMLSKLERTQRPLSQAQRDWLTAALDAKPYEPPVTYENSISSGKVSARCTVPTIEILKPENLPKRPPTRRSA